MIDLNLPELPAGYLWRVLRHERQEATHAFNALWDQMDAYLELRLLRDTRGKEEVVLNHKFASGNRGCRHNDSEPDECSTIIKHTFKAEPDVTTERIELWAVELLERFNEMLDNEAKELERTQREMNFVGRYRTNSD